MQVTGEKERGSMKQAIKYTDAPSDIDLALDDAIRVLDFLPPPDKLVEKREKEKITILLDKNSVDFFKKSADKQGVKYQTMINNLLDEYVRMFS